MAMLPKDADTATLGGARVSAASPIERGLHVVLRDSEGTQKVFHVAGKKDLHMGRYPAIPIESLEGLPYGATLRWKDGKWIRHCPFDMEDLGSVTEAPEIAETNQHLAQDNSAQALRPEDISALKQSCSGEKVVETIASNSATFATKTKFSQEKYIKKKQQKHVQQVTCLRPTLMELCETYLKASRLKSCGLRFDYLTSALCHADVRSGGRYMVLDCASGLVTGAMARQLGGSGRVFRAFGGGCSDKALNELDLGDWRHVVQQVPIDVLASSDPLSHEWALPPARNEGVDAAADNEHATEAAGTVSADAAAAFALRQEGRVRRHQERRKALEEFLDGRGLDAVLIFASEEDDALAARCLEVGLRKLQPGGRLVVFGHFLQPLAARQGEMRESEDWVNVRVFQLFTREYQVLPQRTHPFMAQDVNHCEGFLLVGTRVVGQDAPPAAKRPRNF